VTRKPEHNSETGRLLLCAMLSVAAHGALLAPWHHSLQLLGSNDSTIAVTLLEPGIEERALGDTRSNTAKMTSGSGGRYEARAHALRRAVATRPSQITTTVRAEPREASTSKEQTTSQIETSARNATGDSAPKEDELRTRIRALIMSDLARHFAYPWIARQRGWEGNVLLRFNVEANGQLSGIHVVRSSGYEILDVSAIESLRQVGHVSNREVALSARLLDVPLPVIYRLTEN
jgi:protein TonB